MADNSARRPFLEKTGLETPSATRCNLPSHASDPSGPWLGVIGVKDTTAHITDAICKYVHTESLSDPRRRSAGEAPSAIQEIRHVDRKSYATGAGSNQPALGTPEPLSCYEYQLTKES
ncbi:hypothetical protein SNOG_13691 [Parastagonospora nodorum SN15]|uniref:Uncharacterized protein n=1 Tax=Phaeosphaeria nodorum (strain SN15 / ATCC MYA-4574 / FGSC 10173) TaxID=321614 RepID=Q0U3H3_PHANO|nr:hypothetical protein SNOG_13691 [Parastagonospora nodorum SN15]EAT79138.1 hypothetical protein SNOG_13691 [Parastagonospora nodorum SN15]